MSLRAINTKDLIKFYIRGRLYHHALVGDDVLNIFNRMLMDICLEQYHDTLKCSVSYDDICFISVTRNSNITIRDLPSRLSELYISRSSCLSFIIPENTAENLKILSLDYTNLITVPIIEHCHQLTQCIVSHSNIDSFHQPIPKSLVELNLRYNVITSFDFTLAIQLQKLDLNNNHLKNYVIIEGNGITFTYLQQESYKHNEVKQDRKNIDNDSSKLEKEIFSSQSVHLTSVNISVHTSIIAIKEWIKMNTSNNGIVNKTPISEIREYITDENSINFLISAFDNSAIHSLTEYTYHEIFDLVWCVAMNHKDKLDIMNRIMVEVTDSINMCFTGKINRIVNSLVGFLECVNIGISTAEQLQLNMQRIVKRVVDNKLSYIDGVCEIKDLFINDTKNEKESWLDAFKDYEPKIEPINCHRIIDGIAQTISYDLTYDNMILNRGVVIGSYEEEIDQKIFFYN